MQPDSALFKCILKPGVYVPDSGIFGSYFLHIRTYLTSNTNYCFMSPMVYISVFLLEIRHNIKEILRLGYFCGNKQNINHLFI